MQREQDGGRDGLVSRESTEQSQREWKTGGGNSRARATCRHAQPSAGYIAQSSDALQLPMRHPASRRTRARIRRLEAHARSRIGSRARQRVLYIQAHRSNNSHGTYMALLRDISTFTEVHFDMTALASRNQKIRLSAEGQAEESRQAQAEAPRADMTHT